MNNPYHDLHYLSKLYREEALLEAHKRHLISWRRQAVKSALACVGLVSSGIV